jgi:acyl-CoA thioester hydrolase
MADTIFKHSLRVPYANIDKMGFVYYANYFVYFEMARAQMLRDVGLPYGELEDRGVMLPVVEAHCEYKKPAHYDDLLTIQSVAVLKGSRLRIDYEIVRDQELIATGYSEHVCMSSDGKVMKPIEELKRVCDG